MSNNANLTIIGDEDQSIYSFKHAHPEGISKFHERHQDTTDESLDVCRRCPTNIVEIANHLISYNTLRTNRKLIADARNEPAYIRVVQWQNMTKEAKGIAKIIKKMIMYDNVVASSILVLAPRRQFGYKVRDELIDQGIHAQSFFQEQALDGNPKKLPKSKTQQAYSLLALAADRNDNVALRCWCGFGGPNLRHNAWGTPSFSL